jgi:outer membrane receptor protein involved in Fe transport
MLALNFANKAPNMAVLGALIGLSKLRRAVIRQNGVLSMHKRNLFNTVCQGVLALGVVAGFSAAARAQTAAAPNTVSSVTVTAPTATAPVSVPITTQYSESTITNDMVKNLPDQQSLQTMLASQPSIFTYQNGPNGVGANIYIRGFNSGQFAETFDGVAINDMFNGGVTGEAATFNSVLFIPDDLDSVFVYRGVNNPAVNSYNSLGGTINFLPKRPSATPDADFTASYGSFSSLTTRGTVDSGDVHGLKQLLQFDYAQSDGWQPNTSNRNANAYYSAVYDAPNGNQLSLIAVFNVNLGHDVFDMAVPLLQQYGGFYQYPKSEAASTSTDKEDLVILGYKASLSSNITFENRIFGGGQDFLRTSYANPADSNSPYELPNQTETYDYWIYYPSGPTYNPKTTFGSDANGNDYHFYGYNDVAYGDTPTLTLTLPSNIITAGGNVTYGQLHSREYWFGSEPVPQVLGYDDAWDERDRRLFASVYAQDEIKLLNDALTVTPGVRYQYAYTTDSDAIGFFYPYGGSVSNKAKNIAPTLGVNYKLTENVAFNFAYGQNIKFPDISAYYNDVPGTTSTTPLSPAPVHLKPEHVNDYELGARYKEGGFSASFDLYREDFKSIFIDTFNAATYSTNVTNGGDATYQGYELQLNEQAHFQRWGDITGYFNFTHNEAVYTSKFCADSIGSDLSAASDSSTCFQVTPGQPVPDVPRILITGGLTWTWEGYRFDTQARYIGQQYTLNDNTGVNSNVKIPGYVDVDMTLARTFTLPPSAAWGKFVKVSIGVINLFDQYYYNEAYVQANGKYAGPTEFATPGEPRSVSGKVEVAF